jgi:LytS/YehU family sensor histidine kinase
MENPQTNNIYDIIDVVFTFIAKHALGFLSIIFGVTTKIYMVKRQARRVTALQCWLSVILSGMSGTIAWYVVQGANLPDYQKAIICGFAPIVIEPITLRVVLWVDPIIDAIGASIKRFFIKIK